MERGIFVLFLQSLNSSKLFSQVCFVLSSADLNLQAEMYITSVV